MGQISGMGGELIKKSDFDNIKIINGGELKKRRTQVKISLI